MKCSLLQRFFSGFMALLVLTTSVGLTVQSHTCRSSGHRTAAIIFSAPQHNCPPPAEAEQPTFHQPAGQAQVKQACCDFGTHLHKLTAATPSLEQTKLLVPNFLLAWLPPLVRPELVLAAWLSRPALWHASNSSPPPRAGRAMLAFVCTWQV
ncbi:hypothetical protein [Hymenobacter metallicola]|uniref:DUF2946 domain-containing protein n=1 Tax=Hymenobacter metallicola TaxID=2563114 RepID=A0A4Z0QJS2_9BACT|nr:hypothetical protein [Hymenobacter metallicola]TGE29509.1 hypothetical protein E5K02_08665 [Hymenobacter metallicola]